MPGLVAAVAAGKIDEVNQLLETGIDIDAQEPSPVESNFFYTIIHKGDLITPLSTALLTKQWAIAQLLLNRGAKVMIGESLYQYNRHDFVANPYLCALFAESWDQQTLAQLLSKTPKLFLMTYGLGALNIVHFMYFIMSDVKHSVEEIPEIHERILFLAHEALLRSDKEILAAFFFKERIKYSSSSFEKYLKLRKQFTRDEAKSAIAGLDFLLSRDAITGPSAVEIKETLMKFSTSELNIDALPVELENEVAKPSQRNLSDLFCELLHYLNPSLPAFSVDSEIGKTTKYNLPVEEIRRLQDVKNFRDLLTQADSTTLLTKIAKCSNKLKESQNPATILITEILLHHAKDKIKVDGKEEMFLNEEQVKAGIELLKQFYSLSTTEKLFLTMMKDQQVRMEESKAETRELRSEVSELKAQLKKANESIEGLTSLIKQIHLAVTPKTESTEEITSVAKPGLFN